MPPPVSVRAKEPTHDTEAGPGYVYVVRQKISDVNELITTLVEPYVKAGRDITAACNACEDGVRLIIRTTDRWQDRCDATDGFARGQADTAAAAAAAAVYPGGGTVSTDAARSTARAKVRADQQAVAAREVLSMPPVMKEAEEVETAGAAAMKVAADSVSSATDEYYGPRSLSTSAATFDIARMHRVATLEHELRALPPQDWLRRYERLYERRENEKLDLLDEALLPLVIELRDTPPPKLVARFNLGNTPRTDAATAARDVAYRLDRCIKQRREENEPPSIGVLQKSLAILSGVFFEVFGVFAPLMSSADFSRRFLGAGNPRDAADPWGVEPDWLARRLPPGGTPLPGWSRKIAKTSGGAIVRAPKDA
jgi:hypothetical protein